MVGFFSLSRVYAAHIHCESGKRAVEDTPRQRDREVDDKGMLHAPEVIIPADVAMILCINADDRYVARSCFWFVIRTGWLDEKKMKEKSERKREREIDL